MTERLENISFCFFFVLFRVLRAFGSKRANCCLYMSSKTSDGLPIAVYTMNNVLLFSMWALVAAIPCQDRGFQSHFNIPKNFIWGAPILNLHDRILEESKKRGRRNACGLLKEIEGVERSTIFVNEMCDSFRFPLSEEQESQVRKRVEEIDMVYESIKKGLDPLEKQVRDVFHRIVSSRTNLVVGGLLSSIYSRNLVVGGLQWW